MVNMQKMKEMIDTFQQIAKSNEKLEGTKGRYIEFGKRLNELGKQLESLAEEVIKISKDIDPLQNANSKPRKGGNAKLVGIKQECFEKLAAGTQITRQFLESAYPNLEKNSITYLFTTLSRIPGVVKARDNGKLRIFYKKA